MHCSYPILFYRMKQNGRQGPRINFRGERERTPTRYREEEVCFQMQFESRWRAYEPDAEGRRGATEKVPTSALAKLWGRGNRCQWWVSFFSRALVLQRLTHLLNLMHEWFQFTQTTHCIGKYVQDQRGYRKATASLKWITQITTCNNIPPSNSLERYSTWASD